MGKHYNFVVTLVPLTRYISPTPKEQTEIKSNDETRKTEPKRHYFYCLSVDVNHKWAFG